MKTTHKYQLLVAAMLPFLAALPLVMGCGGGATTETTVVIKPASDDGEGENGSGGSTGGSSSSSTVVEGFGTLKGRVLFTGDPPQLPPGVVESQIKPDDRAVCIAAEIPNETLVVTDGGIANVFIFLEKPPAGVEIPEPSEAEVVFDQKGCKFTPHAMLVRTGTTLLIKSGDAIAHNTNIKARRNDVFNQIIKPNDRQGLPFVYKRVEKVPVQVVCDIHAWMSAYHLPLDHPWGAVTGPDGSFEIKDVPAGKHEFRVWHERAKYLDRGYEVEIKPDKDTEVTLSFGPEKLAGNDGPDSRVVKLSLNR